jgi:hypothetical protein
MNLPKIDHSALMFMLFSRKPHQRLMLLDIEERIRELERERDALIAERVESDHYASTDIGYVTTDEAKWTYLDRWIQDYACPLSCATWFDWYERRKEEEQATPD